MSMTPYIIFQFILLKPLLFEKLFLSNAFKQSLVPTPIFFNGTALLEGADVNTAVINNFPHINTLIRQTF